MATSQLISDPLMAKFDVFISIILCISASEATNPRLLLNTGDAAMHHPSMVMYAFGGKFAKVINLAAPRQN
jgi:hypothetical protein